MLPTVFALKELSLGLNYDRHLSNPNKVMDMQASPPSAHGDFARVYGGRETSLAAVHKMAIDEFLGEHSTYRMQELVEILHEKFPEVVWDESVIKKYIDNQRDRKKKDSMMAFFLGTGSGVTFPNNFDLVSIHFF